MMKSTKLFVFIREYRKEVIALIAIILMSVYFYISINQNIEIINRLSYSGYDNKILLYDILSVLENIEKELDGIESNTREW